jgi:hypothetical protein
MAAITSGGMAPRSPHVQAGDGEQMCQAGIAHGRDHLGRDGAALAGQTRKT